MMSFDIDRKLASFCYQRINRHTHTLAKEEKSEVTVIMYEKDRSIYVVGHKNPDTDSICSAIAYAALKREKTNESYIAMRAGAINEETRYVLNYFDIPEPELLENVSTQVKDIDIREVDGIEGNLSLKKAWEKMKTLGVVTLPITRNHMLEGLITVGDIANAYMDVYDNRILGIARTQYSNIVETVEGTMLNGNPHGYVVKGKVLIAAANPDLMENYIEEDDIVILGNRYESQLCAIEMKAACIIVCEGAPVSMTIKKLAEEKDCVIISTPHDTYTVARLINQSMPVKHFMRNENLITFDTDDMTDSIKEIMAKKRHRDFPVIDGNGNYIGMISRRNLLDMKRKKIILVDHNEKSQTVEGIDNAEILEIIDHHRLGALETVSPVYFRNQPLGCTATIIYQIYIEQNVEISKKIAGLLCAAIISDTLMFRSPTCTKVDEEAAKNLAKIAGIEIPVFAKEMFSAGSNLKLKSDEEIFFQDFKRFDVNEIEFGVGQITSMDAGELEAIKIRIEKYISDNFERYNLDMIFFMLTNIIDENSEVLVFGDNAKKIMEQAFPYTAASQQYRLEHVVSRKKQFIPNLVLAIQQMKSA